jgi:hypothetical protein
VAAGALGTKSASRHARLYAGHPRLSGISLKKDVGGRAIGERSDAVLRTTLRPFTPVFDGLCPAMTEVLSDRRVRADFLTLTGAPIIRMPMTTLFARAARLRRRITAAW